MTMTYLDNGRPVQVSPDNPLPVAVDGGGGSGGGLRLPTDYRLVRADLDQGLAANIIAANPRFYLNSVSVYVDPTAYRTAGAGPVTFTLYMGGADLINRTFWLPGEAPVPTQPTGPFCLVELTNLDYWSVTNGENLRMGLTAGLSGGMVRAVIAGGSGTPPE